LTDVGGIKMQRQVSKTELRGVTTSMSEVAKKLLAAHNLARRSTSVPDGEAAGDGDSAAVQMSPNSVSVWTHDGSTACPFFGKRRPGAEGAATYAAAQMGPQPLRASSAPDSLAKEEQIARLESHRQEQKLQLRCASFFTRVERL
ncbi:putative phospholipase D, partial [Ixodes scapularis]